MAIILAATTASAGVVTPPAGWTKSSSKVPNVEVYTPPAGETGVELVVSTAIQALGLDHRGDAVRAALDDLHGTARRAALTGSGVAEDAWQERTDATAKLVDGSLAFRDPSADLAESARIVIAGDAKQLVAVTGECIANKAAKPATVDACKAALATLDPGIAPAERVAPVVAPQGTPPKEPLPPNGTMPDVTPNVPSRPGPTMSEGTHTPLPPIQIPQEAPAADRRPVFIGAGIVFFALVFWWNMRRRARDELEDQENHDDR